MLYCSMCPKHISTVLNNENILEFTVYSGNVKSIMTAFRIKTAFTRNVMFLQYTL